ncbi:MAG: DEAD/DEAH box helicase [Methylococcaceae bacterium]
MKVLHCAWLPEASSDFYQPGDFWLWMEQSGNGVPSNEEPSTRHLDKIELITFLTEKLGLEMSPYERRFHFNTLKMLLPARDGVPLMPPELDYGSTQESHRVALEPFEIDAYRLTRPIKQINELRFQCLGHDPEVRMGNDYLFWHYYTQALKGLILRDRYVPVLKYRSPDDDRYELHAGFELISEDYETLLEEAVERMPPICRCTGQGLHQALSFLRHCSEVLIRQIIGTLTTSAGLNRKMNGTLLTAACASSSETLTWKTGEGLDVYRHWQHWYHILTARKQNLGFDLTFCLNEAPNEHAPWTLLFSITPRNDPSYRLDLADYWNRTPSERNQLVECCNPHFEKNFFLSLGLAARIYPKLWEGLETTCPTQVELSTEEAFAFLLVNAWVLEDAGFRILTPVWWSPEGRRRARVRLTNKGHSISQSGNPHPLGIKSLVTYRYDLSLGDETLTEGEWQTLVDSKTPVVRFRGQWLALDRDRMREMLEFWRKQKESPESSHWGITELIQKTAEDADFFDLDPSTALADMLSRLRNPSRLEPIEPPTELRTALREYQQRGLAWISYLEQLGLNGCLADDMGLGKTVQVIARLVQEREAGDPVSPTLLIAPTSVIGNWQKEIERFAPHLQTLIHHGNDRLVTNRDLRQILATRDVVITSYALVRKDEKLLAAQIWKRVVLDEAQNIKNPLSAQSKAVSKIPAEHRLALTGTPVENRLLDLWSIFNFLNPGYLGRQTQFRRHYELPIQRDYDVVRAATLKRLIEPFVLRRVKTDPDVIRDLPDKVENRQYNYLSREQASLYEAVVRDVEARIGGTEGLERQGLMLSTLTRLKQICNHPAQFLRDGSPFTVERSPKLERLKDMLETLLTEQESALVFTQFAEIGTLMESFLRKSLACPVFYLHGAVSAGRRERMITRFQDEDTEPGVFILSLKAGGVGINLTKANHVFHFDRWWNPAVEDQATDRAFRIGQSRNVFVHKFVTFGTLEERIDRLIEEKKQMAALIVGTDESWLSRLDNETITQLIALNNLAVME